MEKIFTLYENSNVSKFVLKKETKIRELKEKFSTFQIEMFISKGKIQVFNTNKYDDITLESIWDDIDDGKIILSPSIMLTSVSTSRQVCSSNIFDFNDLVLWEQAYLKTMEVKYQKLTRNFSKEIKGKSVENPQIYLIPRERGGPSYKDVNLNNSNAEDIFFAPVSKGYSMQDVSSFTLGPVVGEGLCIVNAAFSKSICIFHIEGGGCVDYKRKNFWNRKKKPQRNIEIVDQDHISVNDKIFNTFDWLEKNKKLWFEEFEKWRKSVALCSRGDFHWTDCKEEISPIAYYVEEKIVGFVEWKKKAYIAPAYDLIPKTSVYKFLSEIFHTNKISLGLVHPKARKNSPEEPMTSEFILDLYNSPNIMACMPYIVAGILLGVNY
jgi:hypothetical protein